MKKSIKIISILLIALMMIAIATPVFATITTESKPSEIVKPDMNNTENITGIGGKITGIIRVVGTIVAVAILVVLGIKYMMGSAEEKAEYKKTLFPYIVGAILIFAASSLTDIVYSWAKGL